MDLQLTGKRAFVSGSTRGIGFAIARGLLREGATVIINGRSDEGVRGAVASLQSEVPGASVSGIAADFTDGEQVDSMLVGLGVVDILVNNVGAFEVKPFAETSDANWQKYLDVNLMSGVRLSRQVIDAMLERGHGRIIFIGSEAGVIVPGDMVHYGVSKAAMLALGNGLSKLTRGTQVTVNTVVGGLTDSDGVADAFDQLAETQGASSDELRAGVVAGKPTLLLERFIEPDEIANLVLFLASPLAAAINGAALRADGGVLASML